mgnify:FL=1
MNFNEHPIVLAFIVVGICALLAVAGVGKTLTIVICFVILITLMLYSGLKAEKEKKEKATQQNREKFCAECAQYKITNPAKLRSAEKKQRFERLVAKYHLTNLSQEELQQMVTQYHAMHTAKEEAEKQQQQIEQKQKEQQTFQQLTLYANLHGLDKPLAMINDTYRSLNAQANGSTYLPTKKESDGAIFAGIASGIGGTVPALMSFSNTERVNQEVRAHNDLVNSINMATAMVSATMRNRANKYRQEYDAMASKLVGDLTPEEVFRYLTIEPPTVNVSELGSVTVTAKVTSDPKLQIFDHLSAFVDGSLIAEIFDGERKIGEAIMVFPMFGSLSYHMDEHTLKDGSVHIRGLKKSLGTPVTLTGMCLFCGKPNHTYTAKIKPGDLWATEQ